MISAIVRLLLPSLLPSSPRRDGKSKVRIDECGRLLGLSLSIRQWTVHGNCNVNLFFHLGSDGDISGRGRVRWDRSTSGQMRRMGIDMHSIDKREELTRVARTNVVFR